MNTSAYPVLEWDETFATGVDEIDEQHMILVHTLNEASKTLGKDSSIETLKSITQNLLSYALYHFETEEELMQEYGYSVETEADAEDHLNQHRSFSRKVVSVRDGINSGVPIEAGELLEFLNQWLVNHILKTDQKLGKFILSKRASS